MTTTTDANGQYQFVVDATTPDLKAVLVFTQGSAWINELYGHPQGVQFSGTTPIFSDLDTVPWIDDIDFRADVSGIDFSLLPDGSKSTHMLSMPDATLLATDVYLPLTPGTSWPVVLYRTPYGKNGDYPPPGRWSTRGYVIVAQDLRGCFDSEGIFRGFMDDGWGANKDGYDTLQWILSQPWCNGQIGTVGGSARGITQNFLAGTNPPGLVCQHMNVAASNLFTQTFFQGGELRRALVGNWGAARGPETLAWIEEFVTANPYYDPSVWDQFIPETKYDQVTWPTVSKGGWYDIFLQGTINNFKLLQHNGQPGSDGNHKLIIGAYGHARTGHPDFNWPTDSWKSPALYDSQAAWLDYWIKDIDTGVMDQPPVSYYVLGDVDDVNGPGNEWRFADDWPIPSTEVPFYLHAGGGLDTTPPAANEATEAYVYNPEDPVPTLGGANLTIPAGPHDQRPVEARGDVLVFTSPVLTDYVEITGKVTMILYAESSAIDTDFTAKLCDVYPDGRSMLVCDGIVKARHRNTQATDEFLTPGTVYEFEIDLWETCIAFNAGHRIRVDISSSNWPRFEANPNTGEPFNQHTHTVSASNTVFHDMQYPSRMIVHATGPDLNGDGLPDPADLDGDSMDDTFEWTIVHFDSSDAITSINDVQPDDDFDGDGHSNLSEYRDGTDPTLSSPLSGSSCVIVEHALASGCAVPGEEVTIGITLSGACDPAVQTLVLRESLPDTWLFKGVSGSAAPDVIPGLDNSGTLEFAWITVPAFPISFTYQILVPTDEVMSQVVSGMAEYRQTGEVVLSDTTEVSVCLEVGGEGEGEGEGEGVGCNIVRKRTELGQTVSEFFLLGITRVVLMGWQGTINQR